MSTEARVPPSRDEKVRMGAEVAASIKADLYDIIHNPERTMLVDAAHVAGGCALSDELLALGWGMDELDHFKAFRMRVAEGKVETFGDLHDYMDANVIGDQEGIFDRIEQVFPRNADPDDDDEFSDMVCDVLNLAQDEVNEWIQAGGLGL